MEALETCWCLNVNVVVRMLVLSIESDEESSASVEESSASGEDMEDERGESGQEEFGEESDDDDDVTSDQSKVEKEEEGGGVMTLPTKSLMENMEKGKAARKQMSKMVFCCVWVDLPLVVP